MREHVPHLPLGGSEGEVPTLGRAVEREGHPQAVAAVLAARRSDAGLDGCPDVGERDLDPGELARYHPALWALPSPIGLGGHGQLRYPLAVALVAQGLADGVSDPCLDVLAATVLSQARQR